MCSPFLVEKFFFPSFFLCVFLSCMVLEISVTVLVGLCETLRVYGLSLKKIR